MTSIKLTLYTDGGARGNPGPAAAGVVVVDKDDVVQKTASRYLGETTNNQAEYRALLLGLETVGKVDPRNSTVEIDLTILMDSELIVRQMEGKYKVKAPDLIPLHEDAKKLLSHFGKVSFRHIPREKNTQADALVNQCLDKLGK
jgi:ribonuclease HI